MTYEQLAKQIEQMSDHQKKMDVTVLINDAYTHLTAVLHMDKDFRVAPEDEPNFVYEEDQPILV